MLRVSTFALIVAVHGGTLVLEAPPGGCTRIVDASEVMLHKPHGDAQCFVGVVVSYSNTSVSHADSSSTLRFQSGSQNATLVLADDATDANQVALAKMPRASARPPSGSMVPVAAVLRVICVNAFTEMSDGVVMHAVCATPTLAGGSPAQKKGPAANTPTPENVWENATCICTAK